jgi:hypothetical protein
MTCHFGLLKEFENVNITGSAEDAKEVDREIVIKAFLHSADISNPCKPWEISKVWSDLVLQEFFNQVRQLLSCCGLFRFDFSF